MTHSDHVPLGVSGSVTMPLAQYVARVGHKPRSTAVLLDEEQRIAYLARRLSDALDRPLTHPGSAGLAQSVLRRFGDVDVIRHLAEKAMETLRDHKSHNRIVITPDEPRLAVLFVAWSGTHRETQSQRFGNYLGPLVATASRLAAQGIQIAGFLEIDAYVRDNADPDDPGRALDDVFEVDVEYSYLPWFLVGYPTKPPASVPNVLMLNSDLLSREEAKLLEKARERQS